MRLTLLSGAGNCFAAVDVFRDGAPSDPAALARRVCAHPAFAPHLRPDGLLVAAPPAAPGADARMILYNADGSRPEACGNGLRCVARLVRERGHVTEDAFEVETDAGIRHVELERSGPVIVGARVAMGPVRIVDPASRFEGLAATTGGTTAAEAVLVSVGNPHAVVVVDDERTAPVAAWGAAIEHAARFPDGTNVGFLAARDGALHLRVWERGVGETLACGSGACAAALVAVRAGLASWPVRLELRGGRLVVDGDPETNVLLAGPCETLDELELPELRAESER